MTPTATTAPPRRPMTELMDRQMPFDLQAEIGVLGSIVLITEVLDDVAMIGRPDDVYDDAHRSLFTHMVALHESGKKIDHRVITDICISYGRRSGGILARHYPSPPRKPTFSESQPPNFSGPPQDRPGAVSGISVRGWLSSYSCPR